MTIMAESAAKSSKCSGSATSLERLTRRTRLATPRTALQGPSDVQRGELIRQLILDELARDSGDPPVSPELVEIIGLRLMLTNLLKPLTTGQKITPEVFDGTIAEVKKHKRSLAIKTRTDLEKA